MVQPIKRYVIVVACILVAYSIGRFTGPTETEVREVEKIVYRERVKKDEDRHLSHDTRETRLPDGTIIKETNRTIDRSTRTDSDTRLDSEISKEARSKNRPTWRLGAIYKPAVRSFQDQSYSITVERNILSELYLGVNVASDKTIGVSISIGF